MEDLGRIISEHPFCRDLEPSYLALLTGCASNVRFERGFYLFREQGEASEFYLIRAGKIDLEVLAPPRPSLTVETVQAGELLGWSWLVPPYRWRFSALAVEPVSAIEVNGRCLRVKCERDSRLGYELLRRTVEIMGQRLDAARFRLVDLYSAAHTQQSSEE